MGVGGVYTLGNNSQYSRSGEQCLSLYSTD